MMNKWIFLGLLSLLLCSLYAQYDEKEILYRRANQLSAQRKFEQANTIYLELIETYPDDYKIIERLIHNYILISKLDVAEQILEEYKASFPAINYVQRKLSILLADGDIETAREIADRFLQKEKGTIPFYRTIANVFESNRQYEIAAEYYYQARNISKDDDLFARELAINLQHSNKFEEAVEESFRFVSKNKNYKNYVLNNFKRMYDEKPSILPYINEKMANNEDETLLEIQALLLAYANDFDKALHIYKKLQPSFLINFANQQFALRNLDIALEAYLAYINSVKETTSIADVKVKIARLYMFKQEYETAKQYLGEIYGDEKMQSTRLKYKTRSNQESRELLAEIAIIQDKPQEKVLGYFKDAKKFAMNMREKDELEFRMVHYLMMIGKTKESEKNLQILTQQQEKGTETYKLGFYYQFLLSILEKEEGADSLLAEMTINMPESDETRQALQLYHLYSNVSDDEWETFLQAFKKKELYHLSEAISLLNSAETKNEYMTILAGDWANRYLLLEIAEQVYVSDFSEDDIKNYAILNKLKLEKKKETLEKEDILEFLQEQPNSFLSPNYRYLLNMRE